MRDPAPVLQAIRFPSIRRERLETLQVNVGYRCNQACVHCHVEAGPNRTEEMDRETAELVIAYLRVSAAASLDITGGAPELNPHFRYLVDTARGLGRRVIDRCNLTILEQPGQEDLAEFLADRGVEIIASLPCYQLDNVDRQRGKGVFAGSIRALRRLNALGYGDADSPLELNLVYNPQGPSLPPPQDELETAYKAELGERYGVRFNRLLTLCNMPIKRFAHTLLANGGLEAYMHLLQEAHSDDNLGKVMCRSLVSVDWRGYVYDCDFNQMLDLPLRIDRRSRSHLSELLRHDLEGLPIAVAGHCYGCTAGQGSSCGGALS